jgi:hypothetical protein
MRRLEPRAKKNGERRETRDEPRKGGERKRGEQSVERHYCRETTVDTTVETCAPPHRRGDAGVGLLLAEILKSQRLGQEA